MGGDCWSPLFGSSSGLLHSSLECVIQKSMSLEHEPASEPLHISVKSPSCGWVLVTQGLGRRGQRERESEGREREAIERHQVINLWTVGVGDIARIRRCSPRRKMRRSKGRDFSGVGVDDTSSQV